jgi:hypothetical protein
MMIVGMLVLFNYLVVWFYYYACKLCYNTFTATKYHDIRVVLQLVLMLAKLSQYAAFFSTSDWNVGGYK